MEDILTQEQEEQEELNRRVDQAIADLDKRIPSMEHPFQGLTEREAVTREVNDQIEELRYKPPLDRTAIDGEYHFEDLDGNPVEGERPEIEDVRSEGVFHEGWTPPNTSMGVRFRIAAYGLDPENLGGTVHAIRHAEDPEAMRERILGIQYRSGFTVERILEDALMIGLFCLDNIGRKK